MLDQPGLAAPRPGCEKRTGVLKSGGIKAIPPRCTRGLRHVRQAAAAGFLLPGGRDNGAAPMQQCNYNRKQLVMAADDELTDLRSLGYSIERCKTGAVVEYRIVYYGRDMGRLKIGPGPQGVAQRKFFAPRIEIPEGCTDYDATDQGQKAWRFADFLDERIIGRAAELFVDRTQSAAGRAELAAIEGGPVTGACDNEVETQFQPTNGPEAEQAGKTSQKPKVGEVLRNWATECVEIKQEHTANGEDCSMADAIRGYYATRPLIEKHEQRTAEQLHGHAKRLREEDGKDTGRAGKSCSGSVRERSGNSFDGGLVVC